MKVNYFLIEADGNYKFVSDEVSDNDGYSFLRLIEHLCGDIVWFFPVDGYNGYMVAQNDGVCSEERNFIASALVNSDKYGDCVLIKCMDGQPCTNDQFVNFDVDDQISFKNLIEEIISNENNKRE